VVGFLPTGIVFRKTDFFPIAALKLNRKFIGIELVDEFYEIAKSKLAPAITIEETAK
jgi:DNA modification methylase